MNKLLLLTITALMTILSGCAANMEQAPQTPTEKLIKAAKAGDKSMVEQLLKEGGDVNTEDRWGYTLLYSAASNGKKDVVEILLAHGANIRNRNSRQDPFYEALREGHKDIASLLIMKGADLNSTLRIAIVYGRADIAEFLIANGADVNAKNNNGDTALNYAITNNKLDIAKYLIAHGADINVKDKGGYTPLHNAASDGRQEIAKILIALGANVNAKAYAGDTPLHLAKERNHGEIVDILVANGADVNIRNNKGETSEAFAIREQEEMRQAELQAKMQHQERWQAERALTEALANGYPSIEAHEEAKAAKARKELAARERLKDYSFTGSATPEHDAYTARDAAAAQQQRTQERKSCYTQGNAICN